MYSREVISRLFTYKVDSMSTKQIMRGRPVDIANRIPRDDWDRAPWNRWTFQNVRQILPTVEVWRGQGNIWQLPQALRGLEKLSFINNAKKKLSIDQWLNTSYTDGFIVTHRGSIVYERYMNNMTERSLHLSQSVAKSIVASVAGILIARRLLDPNEAVAAYLPELRETAWSGATLQQVMDMTTGVRYVEDYEALDSDIALTDLASGWRLPRKRQPAPACVWDQILTLKDKVREHGELFQYRSIETDVMAHCMERVTQTPLAELISRELWSRLGCEESADFTVDSAGYPLACGGFSATLRDYARFGLMLLNNGIGNQQQIVPGEWLDDVFNCNPKIFGKPYTDGLPKGAYRNQFWVEDHKKHAFMARGVFGQLIYVNRDENLVAVKLSSWPEFLSVPRAIDTQIAIHTIAKYLNHA